MSLYRRSFAAVLLAATLVPAAGHAADYDPPIYVEEAPEYVPVEIGSGWYLRGDIGYAFASSSNGDFTYRTFDTTTATYGSSQFNATNLNGGFSYGGGFGYRFNDWLRADMTVDRFNIRFNGDTSSAIPCSSDVAYVGTTCRSESSSTVTATSIMANGYVDLGTYVGLTPYVGAGAGMVYMDWDALESSIYCVDGAGTCPAGLFATSTNDGAKDWRFTYSLMAGVAYDVTNNLKLDVGYRFRRIAGGNMFGWDAATATAGATGLQGKDSGFTQHEVKLGLRYELW